MLQDNKSIATCSGIRNQEIRGHVTNLAIKLIYTVMKEHVPLISALMKLKLSRSIIFVSGFLTNFFRSEVCCYFAVFCCFLSV